MCGIAGIIAPDEQTVRDALSRMVGAQAHRGPDDSGISILPFGQRVLGLGHRRLSIIDLSSAGHQPMVHPGTGDQIIFNGEIYNFAELRDELLKWNETFAGHSDTEVLLHALSRWGPMDVLRRLAGMYTFGFYDARNHALTLARDPLGIKPLYIAEASGAILFASEVRAILASGLVPRDFDRRAVATLLAYGAVQQPLTMFAGIRSFAPGTCQIFDAHTNGAGSAPPPRTFWSYPSPRAGLSEPDALAAIKPTLDRAVREHLIADVPVGVFLSSGLDSTIVAGLAARHTEKLRSFTISLPDLTEQRDLAEVTLAAQTAKLFGLEHTQIEIGAAEAEQAAVNWLAALDQPSIDGLNVYLISKVVRAQGITVALSGQGGDELFGGYPSFRDVPKLRRMLRRMRFMPSAMRATVASGIALRRPPAFREKLGDMARTDGSLLALYLQRRRAMSDRQLASLGLRASDLGLDENFLAPESLDGLPRDGADAVASISQYESRFYQGNMLLRDADANGMAHGLEIRVPLLDQRVADFMYQVPGRVRLPRPINDKHLLRAAFPELLRPEILNQEKRGFALPIARWMLGPLRELCDAGLRSAKSLGMLDTSAVDEIWQTFTSHPDTPIWSRAFVLCVLGIYAERVTERAHISS